MGVRDLLRWLARAREARRLASGALMLLAALLGFMLAAAITLFEHRRDPPSFWGQRLGRTRARRANLPAGGALTLVAALVLGSSLFLAAASGMAAAAIAGRLVDPLAPP